MFKKKDKQKEEDEVEVGVLDGEAPFDGYAESAAEPFTTSFEFYKPSYEDEFEVETEDKNAKKKKRKKGEAEEPKSKFNTNDLGEVGHNLVQSVLDLYSAVKYFREKEFMAKRLLETGLDAGLKISRVAQTPELLHEAKLAVADLTFVLDAMLLDKIYTRHRAAGVLEAVTKANSLLVRQNAPKGVQPVQTVSEPVQAVQPVVQAASVEPIEAQTAEGARVFLTPIYSAPVEQKPAEANAEEETETDKEAKKSKKSKPESDAEKDDEVENIDSEGGFYEDYVE